MRRSCDERQFSQREVGRKQGLCVLGTAPGFPNPRPLTESLAGKGSETEARGCMSRNTGRF